MRLAGQVAVITGGGSGYTAFVRWLDAGSPVGRRGAPMASGDGLRQHVAVDVGQAEIAAGVAIGQLLVVEAEQVQDRGVQVVDAGRVLNGLEAEIVGRAVDRARP